MKEFTEGRGETSQIRHLVLPYIDDDACVCDVGFGGDKICNDAVGIDMQNQYTMVGEFKTDIVCDVGKGIPVDDNTYDVTYSSHLIEDFINPRDIFAEFVRITKPEGRIILAFPDQKVYESIEDPKYWNKSHKIPTMGMRFMLGQIAKFPGEILFQSDCEISYNCVFVFRNCKREE